LEHSSDNDILTSTEIEFEEIYDKEFNSMKHDFKGIILLNYHSSVISFTKDEIENAFNEAIEEVN